MNDMKQRGSAVAGTASTRAARKGPDPIADGLRQLWADVEAEPVPDDFFDILDRIDAARANLDESGKTSSGSGGAA